MANSESGQNFDSCIDDASSNAVASSFGVSQQSVTSQQTVTSKANPKTSLNSGKRVTSKSKPKEASPTHDPQLFIRRIVYRECHGKIILGSVHYYDGNKKMFYVVYDDEEELYVKMSDLLNNLATDKEIKAQETQVLSMPQKENAKKPKSKLKLNSGKEGVTKKETKGTAIATAAHSYNPQQFIGRIIFKEYNGETILGSAHYYDPKKKMFYVEYDDGDRKFVRKNELFSMFATEKEVYKARGKAPPCSKKGVAEKKRSMPGETSAPTKKRNTSAGPKIRGSSCAKMRNI